ncbi:MAG: hypothetical protein M4579_003902 [Chaenotheca gracillima]|nr:MAG: hypothetical protein M4579_003902 [Chaenotheca gracillima]
MLLPRSLLCFLAVIIPFASADVQFTSPAAGASVAGGNTVTVQWKDSGDTPKLAQLQSYQLFLMSGSNDEPYQLASITDQGQFSKGNKASGTIQIGVGASTPKNAYFLKMISVATQGGTVINYSDRFSLTGMTGTFPPDVVKSLKGVTGTTGPKTSNQVSNNQNQQQGANGQAPSAAGPYGVPYTLQTGLTRYAPMQPKPGTKITAKQATPLWPTSSVSYAKTFLPLPSIQTTFTQSATWSVKSRENTAAAAAKPTDDMQKFLARWKD